MSTNMSQHQDVYDYKLITDKNISIQENDYIRLLLQAPFDAEKFNLILFLNHAPVSFCEMKLVDFTSYLCEKEKNIWTETINIALETGVKFSKNIGEFAITGISIGRAYIITIDNHTDIQQENKLLKVSLKSISTRANRFEEYCHLIQEPFWIRDKNLELLFVNQAFLNLMNCQDLKTIKEQNLWICNVAKSDILAQLAIQKNDAQSMDITYVKDGKTVSGSVIETPITNDDGQFYLFGYLNDQTIEKQLEQRVTHLESGIQEILSNVSIAASLFDSNRRLRFYNQAFVNLWKLDPNYLDTAPDHLDILDKLRASRLIPESRNYKEWRNEIFQPYQNLNDLYEQIWHTPQNKTLKCTVSPYANGGVVCLQEDITDYMALEQSHTILTDNLRNTLNALDEGILLCDITGKIKVSNIKIADIFTKEIQIHTHLTTLLENLPEENPLISFIHKICFYIQNSFPEDNKYTQECVIDDIIYMASMMRLSTGDILIYVRDETALLNYQKMLQFKSDMLKENEHIRESFFRRISHNLRDPMTAIAGFAEMLQTEIFGTLNPKQSEYIADMRSSVNDLLQITDNLAELVRLDTNISRNFNQIALHSTLNQAVQAMRNEASYKNITFKLNINQEIFIDADDALLRQSLIQIIENAINYSPRNSDIQVILTTNNNQANIQIIDQGNGIDDTVINALKKQDINDITGYGLRYVMRVCKLHNAQCYAHKKFDDEDKPSGTCITLIFPLEANNTEYIFKTSN